MVRTHREQFLNFHVGLDFVFVCLFRCNILIPIRVFVLALLLRSFYYCVACFCVDLVSSVGY